MRREELKKNQKGITLIVLIITVILLMILAGLTVKFIASDRAEEQAEKYKGRINEQMEEQKSLSNMVRNLYDTNSSK